jgi:outer membrane receptor protein involved in Fe transport
VAVAAISQTALQNNAANTLQKIGELAPQVSIGKSTTGTGATITIRGISSSGVDAGLDQSVSMSIDGVSLSRGRIVQSAMFDMQQVEIMKGPQALFFGKNSPAGVISITSADPTDRFEGFVKGGYEFKAKERYGEAVISGPLSTKLRARLAFRYDEMDGWIKNNAPAEANPFQPFAPLPGAANGQDLSPRSRDISGRLTLIWEPTDDFDAKFKLTMNNEKENGNSGFADNFCTNGLVHPNELGVPSLNADCAINMVRTVSNYPAILAVNYPYGNGGVPYLRSALALSSLTLNKKFENITVTSTTGYYDQSHKGSFTGDYMEFAQIYDPEAERYRLINEELRVNTDFAGPLNAMAGGYIEHSHRRWFNAPSILNIYNTVAGNYTTTTTRSLSNNDSYSLFGQLRWKIIPSLELAGGARYSHDKKESVLVNEVGNPAAPAVGIFLRPDNLPLNAKTTGNNVSPEVTLTWKPQSDQTLYVAYKSGYKAGGISNGAILTTAATPTSVVFGPEHAKGFEVGYKADLFANTLRLDVVAYRYNYNGLQVTSLPPPTYSPSIKNAAKARTTGVEGSVTWMATDRLTLDGNFGYNRARYLSFPNAQCWTGQAVADGCIGGVQDLTGRPLQRAPDVTFKLGANYKADLPGGWLADLSASAAYSASYLTSSEYSPGGPQPSYWLINASVRLSPESDKYSISLIGRNLTNTYYRLSTFTQGIGSPYQYTGYFNRPREVVVEAQYNF